MQSKQIMQFDRAFLKGKTTETDEGFLVCDAVVTRPGVFPYLVGGKISRTYCPPEVVLDEKTYKTLALKPLVNGHPYTENGGIVNSKNAKKLKIGSVGETITVHDQDVMVRFVVTDSDAIDQIRGGRRELSCGYLVEYDNRPGVTPDGEKYDRKQISRSYNHLSLEQTGRVGNAKIVLDSGDEINGAELIINEVEKNMETKTIQLDGIGYEVATDAVEKIITMQKELLAKKAELDAKSAELDAVKSDLDGVKKELESKKELSLDAETIEKKAREFADVIAVGKTELDSVDDMSVNDIKLNVCKKAYPDISLDGKSEDYINATFDRSVEKLKEAKPATKSAVKSAPAMDKKEVELDAREKMINKIQSAYKEVK